MAGDLMQVLWFVAWQGTFTLCFCCWFTGFCCFGDGNRRNSTI